ncbi:hypothetical protein [Pseudofrankia sp. DC12]|uniref:hypothetical protein n=1 Tax=Pseudofrankia sp. DC12 TaxID=683315 RepID=UPI000AACF198|nr:hypothetical protein [Pseudofrankia sp. DC12]
MHPLIEARRAEIERLCRRLDVRRLDVFGSVVSNAFDLDTSDGPSRCSLAPAARER